MPRLNAGNENLSLLRGGIHFLACLAEIDSGGKAGPISLFEVGTGNRRNRLSPVGFLRNTDQNMFGDALLQQAHSTVHAQFFGGDRALKHDSGINVSWKGAVGYQEVCPPAEPAEGQHENSGQQPPECSRKRAGF